MPQGLKFDKRNGDTLVIRSFGELEEGTQFHQLMERPVRDRKNQVHLTSGGTIWKKMGKQHAWSTNRVGLHEFDDDTLVIEVE